MRLLSLFAFFSFATLTVACAASTQDSAEGSGQAATARGLAALRSTDGTSIDVSYQLASNAAGDTVTKNVSIRVSNDAWSDRVTGKSIRVVLLSYCGIAGVGESLRYNESLDVPYTHLMSGSGFGYEVQLATRGDLIDQVPLRTSHIGLTETCRQELAAVVDGIWTTDPVNGTHNFKFTFQR